jgi:hypothetical protein
VPCRQHFAFVPASKISFSVSFFDMRHRCTNTIDICSVWCAQESE